MWFRRQYQYVYGSPVPGHDGAPPRNTLDVWWNGESTTVSIPYPFSNAAAAVNTLYTDPAPNLFSTAVGRSNCVWNFAWSSP